MGRVITTTELDKLIAASEGPMFYVVSKRKLATLFLSTFSMYILYWYYKNWDCYKRRHPEASRFGRTISPVLRAAFWMFFTHALFGKIKAHGREQPQIARWHNMLHASILVAMLLASEIIINVLLDGTPGDIASLASIFVLLLPFLAAQGKINISCGDPQGQGNDRLTKANWAWVLAGGLLWVLVFAGVVLPGDI
jgi:hypothetical protein